MSNNSIFDQLTDYASPIFPELVMRYLEIHCLDQLKQQPAKSHRYVDDIANKGDVKNIINTFNSCHQKLQFTFELEENNVLAC